MAAAPILYVGVDDLDRVPVMRSNGLAVVHAEDSIIGTADAFASGSLFSAIALQDVTAVRYPFAIEAARSRSKAPVILFGEVAADRSQDVFPGLIVPNLTPPSVWLDDLREFIAEAVQVRELSRLLREEASLLREQSRALRAQIPGCLRPGSRKFVVTMKAHASGVYSVIAEHAKIHDEHLVLIDRNGMAVAFFLREDVASCSERPSPRG